jgi:hypothetical protein
LEILTLVKAVDKAYSEIYPKSPLGFKLKIWKPFLPGFAGLYGMILFLVIWDSFFVSLPNASDKVNLTVNLVAVALALGAVGIALVAVVTERMKEIEQDHLFEKVEGLIDPSEYPIVRALVKMRVKSRNVILQDIYIIHPSLFERKALMEKLVE